jgi:hypothetical protein
LIDCLNEEDNINEIMDNLRSGKWTSDPYTGKKFKTVVEKENYIKKLKYKRELYKKAFTQRNKDILKRFYTLNIEREVRPDLLASVISLTDMSKIPDHKFTNVEFEDVSCHFFLNPKLYQILARITKPEGKIKLSVTNACRRLLAPVIQPTKFGDEFEIELQKKYSLLEKLHPTYHRLTFTITN